MDFAVSRINNSLQRANARFFYPLFLTGLFL